MNSKPPSNSSIEPAAMPPRDELRFDGDPPDITASTDVHDPLTQRLIGCAIEVHRALGPGLLESTYEEALRIEFDDTGLQYVRQLRVPVSYKGRLVGQYKPDFVVQGRVVVEVKSVERLIGVHRAQVLAYMRALRLPVGLLLNFYTEVLRTGIKRLAI